MWRASSPACETIQATATRASSTSGIGLQVETARGAGNGLGLAIVRRAAEAHGALLRFENQPPGGLIVTVEFRPAPTL